MSTNPDPIFRASSVADLMTEPKTKGELLSVGAKTHVRNLAKQAILGVEFEVTSREMQKGTDVEPESLALVNEVLGLSLVKHVGRVTRDGLSGEPDALDRPDNCGYDVKSSWSAKTFQAFEVDAIDKTYEYQARAYMALFDIDRYKIAYCLVDTPENLIGYEPVQLHLVSHIPAHLRITTWEIQRDAEKETRIFQKIKHATEYYRQCIEEFDKAHQKREI